MGNLIESSRLPSLDASKDTNENLPRMGERIRLKKDFDISGFSP
jgi:hypothetical protein